MKKFNKEGEIMNDMGGYDYLDSQQDIAKKVDLITLPTTVEGTNCSNCMYVKILDAEKGLGFCTHKDIQLPVTARMCCSLWDAKGASRSWENKMEDGAKIPEAIPNFEENSNKSQINSLLNIYTKTISQEEREELWNRIQQLKKNTKEMETAEFKNGGEVKLTKADMLKKLHSYHKHSSSPAIASKYKNLNTAFKVKTGKSYEDILAGGKADGMDEYDLAKRHGVNVEVINQQLKKGQKVELEHIDNNIIAREIALDHLFEMPDYYDRLEMMEKQSGIKHTIDTMSHLSNIQIKSIKNYLSSKGLSDSDAEVHSNGNILIYKGLDNNTLKQIKLYLKNTLI